MNNSETKYLYSKDNTELYHEFIGELNQQECLYSRNVIAMMDGSRTSSSAFYEDHILTCKTCMDLVKRNSLQSQQVRASIPHISIPSNFTETVRGDLKEAVALYQQNRVEPRESLLSFSLFLSPLKELVESKLILKSVGQGSLLALLTFILLSSVL